MQRNGIEIIPGKHANSLLSFGAFLGDSLTVLPRRFVPRFLWSFLLIFSLLITATYKGGLISKLALPKEMRPINTLKELTDSKFQVGGYVGLKYMLQTPPSPLEKVFQEIENIDGALENVARLKRSSLLESKKWILYMREKKYSDDYGNHLIHTTKECSGHFNIGFIFPIDSKYFVTFNRKMLYIMQSGLTLKWYKDVLRESKSRKGKAKGQLVNYIDDDDMIFSTNEKTILSLTHLRSAFVLLCFGLTLSTFVFLYELSTNRIGKLPKKKQVTIDS